MKRTRCPFCGKPGLMRVFNIARISSRALGDLEADEPYPTSMLWEAEGEPYYCPACGKNVWDRDLQNKSIGPKKKNYLRHQRRR